MAKFRLGANADIELLTREEVHSELQAYDAQQVARLRAAKPVYLPLVTGKAVASALSMGGDSGEQLTAPAEGSVWSLRHLVIEGLATGTNPDVVNVLRGPRIIWQLNGNQFAQTFGRGEILILPGQTLGYQSVGTFTSTATILAHGLAQEVPAELVGRFYS